jgi:hypothetical protein
MVSFWARVGWSFDGYGVFPPTHGESAPSPEVEWLCLLSKLEVLPASSPTSFLVGELSPQTPESHEEDHYGF